MEIDLEFDINHLTVKELTINVSFNHYIEDNEEGGNENGSCMEKLRSMIVKQPELRSLQLTRFIDEITFDEICKLQKLENLCVTLIGEGNRACIGGLSKLKNLISLELSESEETELEYWPGSAFLGQVKLPKLQKLRLEKFIEFNLDPEIFAAMGSGMPNLQQFEIRRIQIGLLPRFIENFQKLKTLKVKRSLATDDRITAPSRPNESLEALTLHSEFFPCKPTYDTLNACPNLKKIDLTVLGGLNADLLDCVQSHRQLESFFYDAGSRVGRPREMLERQHHALVGIIDHFRQSPRFLELRMKYYSTHKTEVKALFGEDSEKVDIETEHYFGGHDYYNYFHVTKKRTA